jgi:hypothetical protein
MVYSNYISQLQAVRDEFAGLATGLPNTAMSLTVVNRNSGTNYLIIDPTPYINNVSAKMVAMLGEAGIQVGVQDYDVKGISAKYTEEQLTGIGIHYLIGADVSSGVPVGGILCQEVMGTLNNGRSGICWDIVLTRKQGR